MSADLATIDADELDRLRATAREYAMTVRVLAIIVERLLVFTDGRALTITDEAITHPPDLRAWRDEPSHSVIITVNRED